MTDYKLVPAEPTPEMLKAAQSAWLADPSRRSSTLWTAMFAAAPDVQGERQPCPVCEGAGELRWLGGAGDEHRCESCDGAGYVHAQLQPLYAAPQPVEQQAEQEPVGWQFFQDGRWWNGDDRIKDHRKNTEYAGVPTRDVFASPIRAQPAPPAAPDVSGLVEALEFGRKELHACQAVIHLRGGFDPAYVADAQKALASMDAVLSAHREQQS